jgi:phenylpropionate dioxygenase-like ring-hydroxylating dioxygenase large terminal subunit
MSAPAQRVVLPLAPAPALGYRSFWYVVAQSSELPPSTVLRRKVLGEWLALFRGDDGRPAALRDRCMHRNAPLSKGQVRDGQLQCPYHGWVYDKDGVVVAVPAEGRKFNASKRRCATRYATVEQDGFVYVRLDADAPAEIVPYRMPHWNEPGWKTVRLVNRFRNTVTNCAENFIDIPHTVYVHDKIFRVQRTERVTATIRRSGGSVLVEYHGETSNLGWFSWFLNPEGTPIEHRDNFHMPNVTEVEYVFSDARRLFIISQTVPEEQSGEDGECVVVTSLTYNFGPFSRWPLSAVAGRILGWQGQKVIDQDIAALADQMEVIGKFGESFNNTAADAIHVFVESIRDEILAGRDPRALPDKTAHVEFWI